MIFPFYCTAGVEEEEEKIQNRMKYEWYHSGPAPYYFLLIVGGFFCVHFWDNSEKGKRQEIWIR